MGGGLPTGGRGDGLKTISCVDMPYALQKTVKAIKSIKSIRWETGHAHVRDTRTCKSTPRASQIASCNSPFLARAHPSSGILVATVPTAVRVSRIATRRQNEYPGHEATHRPPGWGPCTGHSVSNVRRSIVSVGYSRLWIHSYHVERAKERERAACAALTLR